MDSNSPFVELQKMTIPDYKALCAELIDELNYQTNYHEADELIDRARAALAQTPTEFDKPTSQEFFNLWKACNSPSVFARRVLERWGNPAPVPPAAGEVAIPCNAEIAAAMVMLGESFSGPYAPERLAPQPVPVSERLPELTDCDAEGQCWWFHPEDDSQWDVWCYSRSNGLGTYWLPANALPLPWKRLNK